MFIQSSLSARNSSNRNNSTTSNAIYTINCDTSDLDLPTCNIVNQQIAFDSWQIEKIRKVTKLTMKNIQNENLPLNLADSFPNLEEFSTSETSFRTLKRENLRYLRKLEILRLQRGELLKIRRDSFDDLENLRVIDLSGNYLNIIQPELFRDMEKLEELYVSDNGIEELNPRTFRYLMNLKTFSADGNKISMISVDTFAYNRRLSKISISRNALRFIDVNAFGGLRELYSLNLSENDCIDKQYSISKIKSGFMGLLKKDVEATCQQMVKI